MPAQKVALITGASSGLGQITAKRMAQHGFRVFGTSRQPAQHQIEGCTMLALDVRDSSSIRACVQQVVEQAGRLDVLVNNAGVDGPVAAAEEASMAQVRALFDTNFFGVIELTNAVLPVMRRQGGGRIINISSLAGLIGAPPFFSVYTASKHALEGYTEALRHEVKPFNIAVSLVEPGYFKTNIARTIEPPDSPLDVYAGQRQRVYAIEAYSIEHGRNPDIVARCVLRILQSESPKLRYPVGLDARYMGTAYRLLPFSVFERIIDAIYLRPKANIAPFGWRWWLLNSRAADSLQWVWPLLGVLWLLRRRKR